MDYDVIVIGGGTAGLGAYRKAESMGKKVLIVEENDFLTTCANVGCMPSKLLIAAAENRHEITKSTEFGINVQSIEIDEAKLLQRVRNERDRFVGFVKSGAQTLANRIIGRASFVAPHTITVNGQTLKAKTFVIATGSRPWLPEIFHGISGILTNENIFEINALPKTLAVFGAGVIGLELGFAFQNLGVAVSLFNRGNKLLKLNQDINDYLVSHIENNMDFIYHSPVSKIEQKNNQYHIYYGEHVKIVDKILVAAGRKPNIDNIGLEAWGIENPLELYNSHTTQIGDLPVFLAGDVNNELTLLHEAAKEGALAGTNAALHPHVSEEKRNIPISVVFSSPQVMQVGQTINLSSDIVKGQVSFEDQGRSRVMLKNKGMLNIYFDRSSRVLKGAEMIGPDAEHIAHLLAWVMEKNVTLDELLNFPFYHPVVEEGLRTAIRNAAAQYQIN